MVVVEGDNVDLVILGNSLVLMEEVVAVWVEEEGEVGNVGLVIQGSSLVLVDEEVEFVEEDNVDHLSLDNRVLVCLV